ncbi:MAG: metal-dependent transcriptional regulator, partial [Clostridia bacterium]|nr:metal-dependent transcriptional regulator [Clostridia bacterium]
SVSRALGILKNNGFVTVDKAGDISLTEEGQRIAEKIYERHTVLADLFERLGVDRETAVSDACKIEHDVSDETFEKIKEHAAKFGNKL